MIILDAPKKLYESKHGLPINIPNGLFRCPMIFAGELMPEISEVINHSPIDKSEWNDWEVDVKVHMLMKEQYPCNANWHCDNVPRDENGVNYGLIKDKEHPDMYLWLSGAPKTTFIKEPLEVSIPKNHGDLKVLINKENTFELDEQTWYSFSRKAPHRGNKAEYNTWRVFVRLTHKSITPCRPVTSYIRRHTQVYLNAENFTW